MEKVAHILSHTLFHDTCMYHLKLVWLVMTFAYSSRHMNVPCCKFETNLNRQSKLNYIRTLRTFRVITWLRLMVDIFGKVG